MDSLQTIIPMSFSDKNLFISTIKAIHQIMSQYSLKFVTVEQINNIFIQSNNNRIIFYHSKVYYNEIFHVLCNSPYSLECFQCSLSDPKELRFSLTKSPEELIEFINNIPLNNEQINIQPIQSHDVQIPNFDYLINSVNTSITDLPKLKEKENQLKKASQELEFIEYFLDHPNELHQELINKEEEFQRLMNS